MEKALKIALLIGFGIFVVCVGGTLIVEGLSYTVAGQVLPYDRALVGSVCMASILYVLYVMFGDR